MIPHNPYDIQVSLESLQRFIVKEFMGSISRYLSLALFTVSRGSVETTLCDAGETPYQQCYSNYTTFVSDMSKIFRILVFGPFHLGKTAFPLKGEVSSRKFRENNITKNLEMQVKMS